MLWLRLFFFSFFFQFCTFSWSVCRLTAGAQHVDGNATAAFSRQLHASCTSLTNGTLTQFALYWPGSEEWEALLQAGGTNLAILNVLSNWTGNALHLGLCQHGSDMFHFFQSKGQVVVMLLLVAASGSVPDIATRVMPTALACLTCLANGNAVSPLQRIKA